MKKIPSKIIKKIYIFCSIILTLWAVLWAVSKYYEPLLKKEIRVAVFKATKGLYRIEFKSIGTNIILGNATIHHIQLIPNWKTYDSLVSVQQAPDNVYELSLEQLQIRGFNPYQVFKNKVLNIRKIRFVMPKITMYHQPMSYNTSKKLEPIMNLYQSIKAYVNAVSVESVILHKAQFKYLNKDSAQKNTLIQNLEVQLLDWTLHEHSEQDSTRFYYFKDAIFTVPSYEFDFQKGLYHGKWENASLLFNEKKITISSFTIEPTVPIDVFQQKLGYRKISVHTQLQNIQMDGVNMLAFLRKGNLLMQKLSVNNGFFHLKNGKNIIDSTLKKEKIIPNQLIQKIPMPFTVDTAKFTGIDISYEEYNKKSNKTGRVYFNNTHFTITNANNIPEYYKNHKWMQIKAQTQLMNQCPFSFSLRMNYLAPEGEFFMNGNAGAINGKVFNQITVPLGLISIKSLDINYLNFDINGNNHAVQGEMKFAYKHLGVSIMRKDEESGQLLRKSILSILANKWVLNDQNPDKNGQFITAPIYLERPNSYVFSKFIWKALLEGIKYSIGITPQKQIQIQQKMHEFKTFKNALQQYKDAREHRQEMRRLRRKNREF